jgi:hypothetical protein
MSEPSPPPVLRLRRTIQEARRVFEAAVLPTAPDWQAREGRRILEQAEAEARAEADKRIASLEQEAREARDRALRSLAEIRDGYEALTAEGGNGRIDTQNYNVRLRDLRQQQWNAEDLLDRADGLVEDIEEIEGDPVAYVDNLTTRFPDLRKDWPW